MPVSITFSNISIGVIKDNTYFLYFFRVKSVENPSKKVRQLKGKSYHNKTSGSFYFQNFET